MYESIAFIRAIHVFVYACNAIRQKLNIVCNWGPPPELWVKHASQASPYVARKLYGLSLSLRYLSFLFYLRISILFYAHLDRQIDHHHRLQASGALRVPAQPNHACIRSTTMHACLHMARIIKLLLRGSELAVRTCQLCLHAFNDRCSRCMQIWRIHWSTSKDEWIGRCLDCLGLDVALSITHKRMQL